MNASRLILIGSVSIFLWTLQAVAEETVAIQVETVLATNSSKDFDTRLKDRREQWKEFRYSSYRLVQKQRRRVGWGKQADFSLPGGRFLQVVPKEYTNERIALHVMIMEGTSPTPLLNTVLSLPNHGMFFFGGRKHQDGTLIVRIGATAVEHDTIRPNEPEAVSLPPSE